MDVLWLNTPRVIRTRTNGVNTLLNARIPTTEDYMIYGTNGFKDQGLGY
jgi:hypothetical protein